MPEKVVCHEDEIEKEICADRWSKGLVGTDEIPTTSGYHADAGPFLEAARPHRERLSIPDGELIRCR